MPIAHIYTLKATSLKLYIGALTLVAAIFILSTPLKAQLVISPPPGGNNYTQLLNNFFVGGGVTISNVVYTGNALAVGSFTSTNTPLQLPSGIIMSTGNRNIAVGPNNSGGAGTDFPNPGIAQLNPLAGTQTYDGAQLQFDFVTQSNVVNFKYQFASEEYPEYVGSINDVFAFFINGPGFGGWTNIALVPGTGQPVSINNVNQNVNSQYYINNAGGQAIQYDGIIRPMTATANVTPCVTYTIRIAIADAADGIFDSAVFLGDNTFNGGIVSVSASGTTNSDTSSYEGCSPAFLTFTLPNTLQQNFTVNYTIGGTAQNGVDYNQIPTSVVIPAGQTSVQLNITSIADGVPEGVETVTITYQAPCGPIVTTIYIRDVVPLTVVASPDVSICNGSGAVGLTAQASGGLPPYNYVWSNGGGSGSSIQVNPAQTTTYTVTATSFCPGQATDQVTVTVSAIPTSTFTSTQACQGSPATVTYTGSAQPNATYNWTFAGSSNVTGSGQGPMQVTYANPGIYNATLSVTENGCTSVITTVPITINPTPASTFAATSPLCVGGNSIVAFNGTQLQNANYTWNFDGGSIVGGSGPGPYQISWATAGTKNITLNVSAAGCNSVQTTVPVTVYAIPTSTFTLQGPICEGSAAALVYTGTADTSAATFAWNLGGGTVATNPIGESYTVSYATSGAYNVSLTVTENGCVSTPTALPITVYDIPTSDFTITTPLCAGVDGPITYTGTGTANANYAWNFDNGTIVSGSGQGPYNVSWASASTPNVTLTVTENGCISTPTSLTATVFDNPTSTFTATTDLCLATLSDVVYTGNASSGANYQWNFDTGNISSGSGQGPYQIDYTQSGNYNITLTVIENGCTSAQSTMPVTIYPYPVANAGADVTVCSGQPVTIGTAPVPTYMYNWINNLTDIIDPTQSLQNFTPVNNLNPVGPDVRVYTLQVKENGCITTDDVTVTVNPQPVAMFTAPVGQCFTGNSYDFAPTGTAYSNVATFAWDFGANATPQTSNLNSPYGISFVSVGQQTVTLTITDYGCTDTHTELVDVTPDPTVNFTATPLSGCPPLVVTFTDQSGYQNATYSWDFGDLNTSSAQNPVYTYTQSGTYDVTFQVSLSPACKASVTMPQYITVYPVPTADFVLFPDVTDQLNPIVEVTNTSAGSVDCSYNFGDSSPLITGDCDPLHTYLDTGTYVVTQYIVNSFGCKDSVQRSVRVNPAFSIYIPTAFTPDGDGLNDVFTIKGIEVHDFTLYIFNRWGQTLFTSNDINNGWDGTGADGETCQIGVYPFRVLYKDVLGMDHEYIGSLTLIK